jgi:hypothetical protein
MTSDGKKPEKCPRVVFVYSNGAESKSYGLDHLGVPESTGIRRAWVHNIYYAIKGKEPILVTKNPMEENSRGNKNYPWSDLLEILAMDRVKRAVISS